MRKYVVIYRAVFIENLQYTANIMMGFITYLILSVVFLNLWGYMYDAPGELIAGYTKEQMIWYVMITEMIWFGARSSTVREQVAAVHCDWGVDYDRFCAADGQSDLPVCAGGDAWQQYCGQRDYICDLPRRYFSWRIAFSAL